MAIILGFGSQQVNLKKQRQYAVKNKGRLSAWGKAKKQIKPIKTKQGN
ncbi:hypothetical protein [Spiroplasma endosymbiont of Agriotes lineatus]